MSKRRVKNEAIENLRRVVDKDNVDVLGNMDVVMADAYEESISNDKHVDEVTDELKDKGKSVVTDNPDEGKEINNEFTAKLVLDEGIDDFSLVQDSDPDKVTDGRARKVYETDDEDDYLDYDMFDFIYGLVTDCWPKPKNPLDHRIRKFMYVGSDDYIKANDYTGVSQVAANGDTIIVYGNKTEDFEDIKEICKLYKLEYSGPFPKNSAASHWNFSFNIYVPTSGNGYPEMVEEYFEDLGISLEDVMPTAWCTQYRKRQEKIEQEADKLIAEREVQKKLDHAIMMAARDDVSLNVHLKNLYAELDAANLTYQKTKIKKKFMDAFDDSKLEEE